MKVDFFTANPTTEWPDITLTVTDLIKKCQSKAEKY